MANQALEQTRDSGLRYGEPVGRELLNFTVMSNAKQHSIETTHRGATNA